MPPAQVSRSAPGTVSVSAAAFASATTASYKLWWHKHVYLRASCLTGAGLWVSSQVVFVKLAEQQDNCWEVMMEELISLNFNPCTNKSQPQLMGKIVFSSRQKTTRQHSLPEYKSIET